MRRFSSSSSKIENVPTLKSFMAGQSDSSAGITNVDDAPLDESLDYLQIDRARNQSMGKSYFIETHGC